MDSSNRMTAARRHRALRVGAVVVSEVVTLIGAACVRQRQSVNHADVPQVLHAAFLHTRASLVPGRRVVIGPYQVSSDTTLRLWSGRDLVHVLADTSLRLGNAASLGRTPRGQPLGWAPASGEVGVSFSQPEFDADTARVLISVVAPSDGSLSAALSRVTLVRRNGAWTVVHKEQLSTT